MPGEAPALGLPEILGSSPRMTAFYSSPANPALERRYGIKQGDEAGEE